MTTPKQCDYCFKTFARVDRHKCKKKKLVVDELDKQTLINKLEKEVSDKTEIILELQYEIKSLRAALRNAESEPRMTTINNNITNKWR